MAESKRTATGGKMNKDLDDRLVPSGQYRDALNVAVGHSEGSDVGALENIRGNELITGQDDISGTVIGSVVDEATEKIYWFTSDTDHDAIYEHDPVADTTSIVLIDGRAGGGGGGGGGGTPTETFTVAATLSGSQQSESNLGTTERYSIDLTASATSTGDGTPAGTRNISTYIFQEFDDNTYTTLVSPQDSGLSPDSAQPDATRSTSIQNRPASATTRYFKVTATDSDNVSGTATTEVAVSANTPAVSVSISGSGTVTQGNTISLTANPSNGTSPYTYSWSGPSSFSSTSQSISVTNAQSANGGTYSVTVTDANGGTASASRSITITTFGTPDVDTVSISGIATTEMQFNGYINHGGNPGSISDRGFYYIANSTGSPFSQSHIISNGTTVTEGSTGTGAFSKVVSGLTGSTTYDVVAWAYNGSNYGYGDVVSDTTNAAGTQEILFSPVSLSDKPAAGSTYQVNLTLNNLPNSLLNTPTITYVTGGNNWITSVSRISGTDNYNITFATMTAQTSTSPTKRVATIRFTNPTSGVSGTLNCSQTLGASISLSATANSINKLGGTNGITATVAFDPNNNVLGQWSFYDTLPSWITPTPNSTYFGTTTQTFNIAYNNSGQDRTHTFDARINDGNQNDLNNAVRDTLTITQNQVVPTSTYEFNGLQEKSQLTYYMSNGSFQQALFSPAQGSNPNDNVLRITVTPTGTHASEISSIKVYESFITGDYGNAHFLVNGSNVGTSSSNATDLFSLVSGVNSHQGGTYNLTITAPSGSTSLIVRRLYIVATSSSGATSSYNISLSRSAS